VNPLAAMLEIASLDGGVAAALAVAEPDEGCDAVLPVEEPLKELVTVDIVNEEPVVLDEITAEEE